MTLPRWVLRGWVLGVTVLAASCAHRLPARPTTQPLASPRNDIAGLPNFARVSPSLYRGAQPTNEGFRRLSDMGVKTVVDLRGKSHRDDLEGTGLKYVHIPSSAAHVDDENIVQFLRVVHDQANQPVFVHCAHGADRTGCAVAAYRMVEQGWTRYDAEAELPRFHYSPIWGDIIEYLDGLDVTRMRQKLDATTHPASGPAGVNARVTGN